MGWTFTLVRPVIASAAVAVCLAALSAWAPPAAAAAAHSKQQAEPIKLDADSADVDNPNKTADFKQIVITQGTMRVQADRAHATGYNQTTIEDGRWTFMGNVRIDAEPRGTLRSDQAVVEIRDQRMTTATATGNPAEFQQRHPTTGELTHGHADIIVYDVDAGTVRLTNNAFITNGRNTITGPLVVYNIRLQRVLADATKSQASSSKSGVHVTIVPNSSEGGDTKPEPPKPPQRP